MSHRYGSHKKWAEGEGSVPLRATYHVTPPFRRLERRVLWVKRMVPTIAYGFGEYTECKEKEPKSIDATASRRQFQ